MFKLKYTYRRTNKDGSHAEGGFSEARMLWGKLFLGETYVKLNIFG
jgi:hypothetical protein